jgi:hypothetical protein
VRGAETVWLKKLGAELKKRGAEQSQTPPKPVLVEVSGGCHAHLLECHISKIVLLHETKRREKKKMNTVIYFRLYLTNII